eukprot:Clim_evm6s154 gene=Clim_evmTU6s154
MGQRIGRLFGRKAAPKVGPYDEALNLDQEVRKIEAQLLAVRGSQRRLQRYALTGTIAIFAVILPLYVLLMSFKYELWEVIITPDEIKNWDALQSWLVGPGLVYIVIPVMVISTLNTLQKVVAANQASQIDELNLSLKLINSRHREAAAKLWQDETMRKIYEMMKKYDRSLDRRKAPANQITSQQAAARQQQIWQRQQQAIARQQQYQYTQAHVAAIRSQSPAFGAGTRMAQTPQVKQLTQGSKEDAKGHYGTPATAALGGSDSTKTADDGARVQSHAHEPKESVASQPDIDPMAFARTSLQPPFPLPNREPPSTLDRIVNWITQDGESHRYALICRHCHAHNGLALPEEFRTISFKCFACWGFNPPRDRPGSLGGAAGSTPMPPSASSATEAFDDGDSKPQMMALDDDSGSDGEGSKLTAAQQEPSVRGRFSIDANAVRAAQDAAETTEEMSKGQAHPRRSRSMQPMPHSDGDEGGQQKKEPSTKTGTGMRSVSAEPKQDSIRSRKSRKRDQGVEDIQGLEPMNEGNGDGNTEDEDSPGNLDRFSSIEINDGRGPKDGPK